ncbi:GDSL-like lipase/acylhydrolase [Clostridium acetireducens DSM 10703]|uniref:GDSL-like lipase/acylhydrolase n=1 Tax=Clostridium acetireducens DSM 10703 TaxID=1121290 RepID=A0A1E8F119_9CLOT|nr:SGNH/GDSL hydrolase family protein [Clostridium acetireducens]OFI07161.1 GDSL-like lipase/acylhydrolase [Clostridium acetireducens DSM 10703]
MKTILCYGDSNTWGYNPLDGSRYAKEDRWSSVLKKELGEKFDVISEGLNGRTTVWDDPIEGEFKNGKKHIMACLHSHKPLDLVIVFLGANDLKYKFSLTAFDIAKGVETLVKIIKNSETSPIFKSPKILVIIPPIIGPLSENSKMFIGGVEKSKEFSKEFKDVLGNQCYLLDTTNIIKTSKIDGVHLTVESHKILGKIVANFIKNKLNY